jgi:hypothetical protein
VRSDLGAHTIVHLKFLARSRVLLGFGLLVLCGSVIGLVPAFFGGSLSNRFDLLRSVAGILHGVVGVITSGLGLFVIWSHRRARTIKMVATKPSLFEGWVASVFIASALVGFVAQGAVAALTLGLSVSWGVPYQSGFAYLAAERFIQSTIALACLTALGAWLHPMLAVLALVLLSESTFAYLATTVAGAIAAGRDSMPLRALGATLSAFYYLAPTFSPFADETQAVGQSMRVATIEWRYLLASAGYAAIACAAGYLATLMALRRSRLT